MTSGPYNDLRDLHREDSTAFTALVVAVPDSHKVKVIYGLGIGMAGIGQISPIAGKLLALFGEGGGILGLAQALLLNVTMTRKKQMKNITPVQIATVFPSRQHTEDQQVIRASTVNTMHQIMKIAKIPAYFVWDRFNQDLDSVQVYKRLMDLHGASTMKEHALVDFLRTCMIGNWRNNNEKPFTPAAQFFGMLPRETRLRAAMRRTTTSNDHSPIIRTAGTCGKTVCTTGTRNARQRCNPPQHCSASVTV